MYILTRYTPALGSICSVSCCCAAGAWRQEVEGEAAGVFSRDEEAVDEGARAAMRMWVMCM